MEEQITHRAALWRCDNCHVWWGSDGNGETTPEVLREATDDPDDLQWDAYRGWHAPGVLASRCPECGRPGQQVTVVID